MNKHGRYVVNGVIKLLVLLAFIFVISSLFKGGDYVRLLGKKTGISLHSVAEVADTIRIDRFMDNRKRDQRDREKALVGN